MPDIKPYKEHRAWHLANMLDALTAEGELSWKYSYDREKSRALFSITIPGQQSRTLHTQDAEGVAQKLANKRKMVWIPVPHHGGERQWNETVARIDSMKKGESPKPWE
jgi:hypothetical protein